MSFPCPSSESTSSSHLFSCAPTSDHAREVLVHVFTLQCGERGGKDASERRFQGGNAHQCVDHVHSTTLEGKTAFPVGPSFRYTVFPDQKHGPRFRIADRTRGDSGLNRGRCGQVTSWVGKRRSNAIWNGDRRLF